jgi:hypothetical protein
MLYPWSRKKILTLSWPGYIFYPMAMYTLSIDPGLRGCGAAMASGSVVTAAKYVIGSNGQRACAWKAMALGVRAWALGHAPICDIDLVIELPQVYAASHQTRKKSGTNPNDLIELAATVGAICNFPWERATVYLPAEWKGQVPKEIMHDRARGRLTPLEFDIIQRSLPRAGLAHNVWDAVTMLMKHVGRW